AKAGRLTLSPLTLGARAQIPMHRRQLVEPFGNDIPDPCGRLGLGPPQSLTISCEPVEIDVRPLPAKGQPKGFSGAVGQFQLSVSASPEKVQIGDPLKIVAKIFGRGKFDRVNAPEVV